MAKKEVHLRDYIAVIRRHDFIIIISFLLIFGSALIASLYMPRVYEASARIEIQSSATSTGLSNLMQNVMFSNVDQVSMETICKRFTSNSLLEEVARNLKKRSPQTYRDLGPPESLAPKIKARIVPDSRMIDVTVRMRKDEGGSQRAAAIANESVFVIQAQRSTRADAEMIRRLSFINDKIKSVESQIDNLDQNIRQFLKAKGDTLVWSARADHIFTRLSNLMDLKEASEANMIAEQKKLNEVKAKLKKEPEFVEYSRTLSRDVLLDKYRTDLADSNRRYVTARVDLGEENPVVKAIEAQINEITKKIGSVEQDVISAKTESRNPTYQTFLNQAIESELSLISYASRRDLAEKMIKELDNEKNRILSETPENQFQLDKMDREVEYNVDIYKNLSAKKLEAEIWAVENIGNDSSIKGGIELVDEARPESRPVSPRVKFISAIAILVGLIAGLAMAFLEEYFGNTYRSPEEVKEDLDIPVLGTIPLIKDQHHDTPVLPVLNSPMSAGAESFRTLVTNIDFSSPEVPYKALLVTSSRPGEGRSFVAANLAVAMAQTKGKVLLVDCDMRKAIQHKIFGLNNQFGLTNLIVGNADIESAIQDTNIPNLRLICCGPNPRNPIELLKSKRLDEILHELRMTHDVLLFDCPPVLSVADTLILASKLDGTLLLANLDHTPRDVIGQAQEQLSRLDIPLLGLICNKMR